MTTEVRRDILTDAWVIVQTREEPAGAAPDADRCPFCAGHEALTPPEIVAVRPNGSGPNQPGWAVRVVPSLRPILRVEGELRHQGAGIHDMVTGVGANEVIVETPEHEPSLHRLPAGQIALVLGVWRDRIADLYQDKRLRYVLVFKNHGTGAGGSVEHSHSELIALPATPRRLKDELSGARRYFEYKERCIFCDTIQNELETGRRVLLESDNFLVFAPYAARFPYELTIIPREHSFTYEHTAEPARADLSRVLKQVLTCLYETLNDVPYNIVLHTAPNLLPLPGYWQTIRDDYHWHIEILPRTRRMAGFEWGSGFHINPVSPEQAVERLKAKLPTAVSSE